MLLVVFDEEGRFVQRSEEECVRSGYKLHDVYTPFPIHGLDKEMGLRDTSIHTAGFIYGITGTATALGFMSWVFTKDWPLNIGGKPHFALPAWIPIMFELTVLFACGGYGAYVLLSLPDGTICKETPFSPAGNGR